ncbi:MAG: 3-deoxy-manno-octulosonate cytidylyltransferase [Phycisphaerae bacterium]
MTAAAIIPARYASTRFPGKPLASATGKPMIQHVYEAVAAAKRLDRVIVATDDERIAAAVRGFGGRVEMTRSDHPTGTDRVAEVVGRLMESHRRDAGATRDAGAAAGLDLVINVQGDEPEMDPASIDRLVELMDSRPEAPVGSLACRFSNAADVLNPACVKVVLDGQGHALYFSRSLIPYPRDAGGRVEEPGRWLLHLGIYAYRPAFLMKLTRTPPTELERIEQLEQLRVLSMGERIAMAVVERHSSGIDTPEQYEAFVRRYRGKGL